MQKTRCAVVGGVVLGTWAMVISAVRADEAAAKEKLAAKGIRAARSGFSLTEEAEFSKSLKAAEALRRKVAAATSRRRSSGGDNDEDTAARVDYLRHQNELLRKRLAEINVAGVLFRGEVSQQINREIAANDSEIATILQSQKQSTKSPDELRKDGNSASEAYTKQVFEARKLADHLLAQYAELNHDKAVLAAIKEWNDAAQTSNTLKPSHSFESGLKRLEALEKKITSGKVPLRQDGKSYYATVGINGEKVCEMIVDTAAPALVLPHQAAVDAGLNLDAATETTVTTADGKQSPAKRIVLKSVRVGGFTGKNVACDVLPASDTTTKPVLGKSFLSQFKSELNSGTSELSLTRLDAESATHKKKKPTPKHTTKRPAKPVQSDDSEQ